MLVQPRADGEPSGMIVRRVVPVLTVSEIAPAVRLLTEIMGFEAVMDHGWIVTLADPADMSKQLSVMTQDATAAVNPCVSVEVDDVDAAYRRALECEAEIVHPLTDEAWGVRRFLLRDASGNVVNVLAHP